MIREGIASIINRQPDLEVAGEACNAAEAMSILSRSKPDLVVTDLSMPGRDGLEFLKDVQAAWPEIPVLVLSMYDEKCFAERALRAGARGYLMKNAGAEKVIEVIRLILSGEAYVSPEIARKLLDEMSRHGQSGSPIEKLSDREFTVFQLIGQGRSTKEVASDLNLSPQTIEAHRANIKKKLKLNDALSLVHAAVCWTESRASIPG